MAAAVKVVKAQFVSVNGVDISAQCKEYSLTYEAEELDKSASGDGTKISHPGLLNWRLTGNFFQKFGAGGIDATLFPLVGSETAVPVIVRIDSAVVAAENPQYSGNGYLFKYPPFGAQHGQIAMVAIEIGAAGPLTRAIA
mgnify:CR=1 FL=1